MRNYRQFVAVLALLLCLALPGWAVGTVTPTLTQIGSTGIYTLSLAWVADGSGNATYSSTYSSTLNGLYLYQVETIPGTTSSYAATVKDAAGTDLMGGVLTSLSTSAAAIYSPVVSTKPVTGALAISISGAGSGGTGTLVLFFSRAPAPGLQSVTFSGTIGNVTSNSANIATQTTAAAILADTDKIPALGQALAAASVPVVLTAAQIAAITPAHLSSATDSVMAKSDTAANMLVKATSADGTGTANDVTHPIYQQDSTAQAAVVRKTGDGTGTANDATHPLYVQYSTAQVSAVIPVKTDQTTHGTTDLVAADLTKIAGTAAAVNAGANSAGVQRVTLATDQTAISTPGVFSVKIDQTSDGTTNKVAANLNVAGTPVGNTVPVPISALRGGTPTETQVPGGQTDTTDIIVMAAAGIGVTNNATKIVFSNMSATSTFAYICDGTCATAAHRKLIVPVPIGGSVFDFPVELPFFTSTNTTLCVAAVTGVTTLFASAIGFVR